jgi:hypothetical protein
MLQVSGYNYQTKESQNLQSKPYCSVDQTKAILTQVLFEPNQVLNDSLSYDITAWALPLAYGVEGYAI